MGVIVPYNPLDKMSLAESIERALSAEKPVALESMRESKNAFAGAGMYALYYRGSFPAYERLAICNKVVLEAPIYVGKADSKGRRKGGFLDEGLAGKTLWSRLRDHAQSIVQADNLDVGDFPAGLSWWTICGSPWGNLFSFRSTLLFGTPLWTASCSVWGFAPSSRVCARRVCVRWEGVWTI